MKQKQQFKRTAFAKSAKSMVSLMLLLVAMLAPQGAWAANHYDAGYESTATTYSAAGIKFKITAVRMYNYQGNNSHFNSNPVVTITAGGHTHTFNLGSLTGESGNSIFYYNGEGNENPYKGSGSFSKRTYEQTVDGIPVKAYFDNQKNEQRVSTNPDKTYKDNGDGSSKWCTADLTIEIGVQTAATVTINGNWRDESDGINKTESYSWPFDIPKHTCNSDIQSDTYRKSAATCTAAAVYYNSCSLCGAAQTSVFSYGSALGHGSTGYTESYSWTGNAYNDASQDTKACTFTLTCKKCSTKVVNGASLTCTKTAHVDATCRATGSTTYQATGSYTAANSAYNYSATKTNEYPIAALGHGTTGYTESYVWTGNAYNDWSQDTKRCTFTLTCKNCSTKVVNGASLTCIKTAHVDASCTATGITTYQATGSYTAANSNYNYSATKTHEYPIAALGHGSTGYTESYSWTGNAYNDASQDTKACTFTLTCKKCSTKVVNGASLTCTKTAHVDASCTATGSTTYQATGSYTAANSNYNYSATKTNVYTVAVLGHSYGAGSWSWEDDGHTATCTRTCSHDANHTSSVSVTLGNGITSELTEAATCSKKGSHTYTATTTVENVEYSDSKEVADIDIDPLNHNYGAGVWSWNNDGHSATCTRTCSYDANHTSSASVTLGNGIESVKLSDPTCGVQGTTRYTAMTTVEGAQYSDTKDIDDIAATGLHTFDDVTDPNHTLCTVCDHSFFRYTATTKVEPNIPAQLKNAKGQGIYNSAKHTFADCNGVMEFDEPLVTIGELAFYNCTEFTGDLIIPNTVITIGINAFYGCGRNTDSSAGFTGNLVIPSSVTSIEEGAFRFCYNFKGKVVIPNSVTSIGELAFFGFGKNNCSLEMQSIPYLGNYALRSFNTKTIVLSDDSYVYTGENPYFPEVQSASYTRRGIKNQFGTLVVPFDVNGMGADYDLYKLDQVCENELVLRMVDVDDNGGIVPAGTPVVFRLHDDLAGDYSLTLTAANTTVSGQLAEGSAADGLQLVGTYETTVLDENDYFISNNQFWRVYDAMAEIWSWGVKVAPFRAYIHPTWAGAKANSLSIRIADEDVTAVDALNAMTEGTVEYYDMNGRKLNSLQNGVNIVKYGNGKTVKVTIK